MLTENHLLQMGEILPRLHLPKISFILVQEQGEQSITSSLNPSLTGWGPKFSALRKNNW